MLKKIKKEIVNMNSVIFTEVTESAEIALIEGIGYGSAWGDFNGDTLPDLYASNHSKPVSLYLNNGDGTFTDIAAETLSSGQGFDTHGAAWADFDNDGDRDIVQVTGAGGGRGSEPTLLFVNEGQSLIDRAGLLGVEYPLGRSRMTGWLDYDSDGWLDLSISTVKRPDRQAPSTIFQQTNGIFEDIGPVSGLKEGTVYSSLSDVSGDGALDLIVKSGNGITVYDTTTLPFTNITTDLSLKGLKGRDIAFADFDGDLLPDLFITRQGGGSDVVQDDTNNARLLLRTEQGEQGIKFSTPGEVTFRLRQKNSTPGFNLSSIFVGSDGISPTGSEGYITEFTLSPDDPAVRGIAPYDPSVDRGIYIGYDPNQQQWQLLRSISSRELTGRIQSTEPLEQLTAVNFDLEGEPPEDRLLLNTGHGFEDRSEQFGIESDPVKSDSVAAADFDNDMDVDLYVTTASPAGNPSNVLYDNQGDGTFIALPDGFGAEGTTLGRGGAVTTVDYDLDGFVDLFVSNDQFPTLLVSDAPDQLFHNQGNNNHWLEIDLEGVTSNRDGIGARVYATAGGISQFREQTNGIHRASQNHQRLHFGLADNKHVHHLEIRWPSGIVQQLESIPANQLIRVVEPSGSFVAGKPDFDIGTEEGVFLWQDLNDGSYHLRTVGMGNATNFHVDLITTGELLEVSPVAVESDDQLVTTEFGFSFDSSIRGLQDGLDFQVTPGAKTLISVTQDGVANPRQLFVGQERAHLAPTGWIVDSDGLAPRPSYTPGDDLGLFVGQGSNPETVEFRWSGDDRFHRAKLSVLAANDSTSYAPIQLDGAGIGEDSVAPFANGVEIVGKVGTHFDGLDVTFSEPGMIGFSYKQDGLFQSHRVNHFDTQLGLPNAYELPVASDYAA
ncbi:MAG: CRTAC1 family protein [Cyanobacteria bacterium J06642_2]